MQINGVCPVFYHLWYLNQVDKTFFIFEFKKMMSMGSNENKIVAL